MQVARFLASQYTKIASRISPSFGSIQYSPVTYELYVKIYTTLNILKYYK